MISRSAVAQQLLGVLVVSALLTACGRDDRPDVPETPVPPVTPPGQDPGTQTIASRRDTILIREEVDLQLVGPERPALLLSCRNDTTARAPQLQVRQGQAETGTTSVNGHTLTVPGSAINVPVVTFTMVDHADSVMRVEVTATPAIQQFIGAAPVTLALSLERCDTTGVNVDSVVVVKDGTGRQERAPRAQGSVNARLRHLSTYTLADPL